MARLASCLVLISLCLCIVIEPTLAAKKGLKKRPMVIRPVFQSRREVPKMPMAESTLYIAPSQAPSQYNIVLPPVGAPFPINVPSQTAMAKQLCQDSKQPELCQHIMDGGKIDPVTEAKLTIEITSSMASRASAYMAKISTRKDLAPGALNGCMSSYKKAINALKVSYTDFETNPKSAIRSLRIADYHVGFCTTSLGNKCDIPPVLKANEEMQGMIQAIRSVAKKQIH